MVLDEVTKYKRNIFTMWFDYKKAFDSIPHLGLVHSLRLAKVPEPIVAAVQRLTQVWATKVFLHHEQGTVASEKICYNTGVLQGDCLALLLFVLAINPLSHLLQKCDGYKIGIPGDRDIELTHLLFVDDLKTYDQNKS